MRISFDIDGVLDTERGMQLARRLINQGEDVFIITARNERFTREVYQIAEALNIPRLLVYFTNGADKWKTIKAVNIDRHYDNNREQIEKINLNTKAEGVLFELWT